MSGPKVDIAELRRQEKERLMIARKRRLSMVDRIGHMIKKIDMCVSTEVLELCTNSELEPVAEKVVQCKTKYKKILEEIRQRTIAGNELIDLEEIQRECDYVMNRFNEEAGNNIRESKKFEQLNEKSIQSKKNQEALKSQKQNKIIRIKYDSSSNNKNHMVTELEVKENIGVFIEELEENLKKESMLIKHKSMLFQVRKSIQEIEETNIEADRKNKRLKRLYGDYEKILSEIEKEMDEMSIIYEDYKKESFDLGDEIRSISSFSSVKEIESAIQDAKEFAEKRISKEYIKRQIDEVMLKHGYNVVASEVLEETTATGQILYGVDNDTAINVFVSDENQVTMRVVGIGFDNQMTVEEDERLYRQQCVFCSLHPQITAELKMRGVILHTKKHMLPDKKFNKKIQTKTKSSTQTISRAKKDLKRSENRVMHREMR